MSYLTSALSGLYCCHTPDDAPRCTVPAIYAVTSQGDPPRPRTYGCDEHAEAMREPKETLIEVARLR